MCVYIFVILNMWIEPCSICILLLICIFQIDHLVFYNQLCSFLDNISSPSILLCLWLRSHEHFLFHMSMPFGVIIVLVILVRLQVCSFWYSWETYSQSTLPFPLVLMTFLSPVLQCSLRLMCNNYIVDVSLGTSLKYWWKSQRIYLTFKFPTS